VCRCGGGLEREIEVEVRWESLSSVGGQRVASWAWGQTPGVISRRDTNAESRGMVKPGCRLEMSRTGSSQIINGGRAGPVLGDLPTRPGPLKSPYLA
jgi:hypothetical protein